MAGDRHCGKMVWFYNPGGGEKEKEETSASSKKKKQGGDRGGVDQH